MRILVPTDGSACALRAVKYAAKMDSGQGEKFITLLTVHDDAGLAHVRKYVPKGTVANYIRELNDLALLSAREALDKAGVAHDMIMKTGHVAEEIVKIGKSGKFDLIVMGAKGRSKFGDLLVGSVAQNVISVTKLPVTLIK